jgi:magnesium transporter
LDGDNCLASSGYDGSVIVENAIYVDGRRTADPASLQETFEACRQRRGVAWIDLQEPDEEELFSVAQEFGLHPLAVEDAIKAHQRPKIERYDETLFVVLKPARYLEESGTLEFSEAHVFVGDDFVVTVRHGEIPALDEVRRRLEGEPERLRRGPKAILHAIIDQVVDDYGPVVEDLGTAIEGVETEVFGGEQGTSRRIYELSREVIEFQRATRPLAGALERLVESEEHGRIDPEVRRYLRDVHDHVQRVTEQIEGFHEMLSNVLVVNLTLVSVRQNDQTKKISAWAAILVVPTIVSGIYGMNFERMPELSWAFGYPFALALMVAICVVLYAVFKKAQWLL